MSAVWIKHGAPLLMPEAWLKLEDEKVTKAMEFPPYGWYLWCHEENPPKEKLALEDIGGSALPKSLIEGFEKILN
jgi:hypothetical protein